MTGGLGTIPSWVVIGAGDKAIPPAGQRFMARRANVRLRASRSAARE